MNQDDLRESRRTDISSSLGVELPEIKLLFYTDDPVKVHDRPRDPNGFGVFELTQHIRVHAPAFARITPTLISRNSLRAHADQKLDKVFARARFDEIWFFGMHQKNKSPYTLEFPKGGGPQSELDSAEVQLLEALMTTENGHPGIGVLMAGDHANPPPDIVLPTSSTYLCPEQMDHETFLSLGRAIGYKVPRAGLMRKWQGPPTHCCEDSFNTQVFPEGQNPEGPAFQSDPNPQCLDLQRFDPDGTPNPQGQPHPLFIGRNGELIEVFPDHMHEGEVVIPTDLNCEIWPCSSGFQPKPRLLAKGTDKRDKRKLGVVAAYDGDAANRGRIVADSSWHHYFNVNLNLFPSNSPPGTVGDVIGQFYGNLVVWLAPLAVRVEMARLMLTWVATHPLMAEEAGSGPLNTGRAAYQILLTVSSPCEINELLVALCPADLRHRCESLHLPDEWISPPFPARQIVLGTILENHYYSVSRQEQAESPRLIDADVIETGFRRAFALVAGSAKTTSMNSGAVANLKCKGIPHIKMSINDRSRNTMDPEEYTFLLELDRDRNQTIRFGLELVPYNCRGTGPVLRCDLSGALTDPATHVRYPVSGGRLLVNGQGPIRLEFTFHSLRFIFLGTQFSRSDFDGRFVCLFREGMGAEETRSFNPEEGDTGTGTGSATLREEDQQAPEQVTTPS